MFVWYQTLRKSCSRNYKLGVDVNAIYMQETGNYVALVYKKLMNSVLLLDVS